jgi:uncharacterized membrane protein YedE/YeeE
MHDFTPLPALLGGVLIGLSAAVKLLLNGRIAGISGIAGGLLTPTRRELPWRAAFIIGLVAGGLLLALLYPAAFPAQKAAPSIILVAAGLLVGFGSRLGSGCTSGHGVCGIARLSKRSIIATMTFMTTGALAVFAARHLLGG